MPNNRRVPIMNRRVFALLLFAFAASIASAAEPAAPLRVGLRRSSYGLRTKNADHAWWAERAKQFAGHFPGAVPTIIEIVSTYQDDDSTQFEFARPEKDSGTTAGMEFARGRLD